MWILRFVPSRVQRITGECSIFVCCWDIIFGKESHEHPLSVQRRFLILLHPCELNGKEYLFYPPLRSIGFVDMGVLL